MSKSDLSHGTVWDNGSLIPLDDLPPPDDVTEQERREYEAVVRAVGNNVPPPVQTEHENGRPTVRKKKQDPIDVIREGANNADDTVLESAAEVGRTMDEVRQSAADLCPHIDAAILNKAAATLKALDSLNSVVGNALNLGDYNLLQVMIDCVQRLSNQASAIGMSMRMGFGDKVYGLAESGDVRGVLGIGGMASVTNEYFDKSVTVKSLLGNMNQNADNTAVMNDLLGSGPANVNRQSYTPSPELHWISIDTGSTASGSYGYFTDTRGGPITILFPSSPDIGEKIGVVDYGRSADTSPITIDPNGQYIDWASGNYTMDIAGAACEFVYRGADEGWAIVVGPILPEVNNYGMTVADVVIDNRFNEDESEIWDGRLLASAAKNGTYLHDKLAGDGKATLDEVDDMIAVLV